MPTTIESIDLRARLAIQPAQPAAPATAVSVDTAHGYSFYQALLAARSRIATPPPAPLTETLTSQPATEQPTEGETIVAQRDYLASGEVGLHPGRRPPLDHIYRRASLFGHTLQ
jgi:hypothetical protein